jgi:50S ribosomal protein L16 3-hydroxylase
MHMPAFDIETFLRDYWQKKPLLIRNPWEAWANPLDPDELAGLACEAGIESRLIESRDGKLLLSHGPFAEDRFEELGQAPWTLLVQAVDHHAPDVAALIAPFRFVPDWRIDDVMVSYATDGGGVGAHFDQYDVFLVQGLGQRRWRVGPIYDDDSPLLSHEDLRLLAGFEATDEWVLGPGDILYVPPGFGHDGVAVGDDCMTYSIGFRAPSRSDLIAGWCDHLIDSLTQDDRYADPDLQTQDNPGEILPAAINRLHAMVMEGLSDRAAFARWFGEHSSMRKYAEADWRPEEPIEKDDLIERIEDGVPLIRNPAGRFSFIRQDAGAVTLFVDGQSFDCSGTSAALAETLCAQQDVEIDPALLDSPAALTLIAALIDQGSIAFDDEAEED